VDEERISGVVVDGAIEMHRVLGGPGLLESLYEEALVEELVSRGLMVERHNAVPVVYKRKRLASDLRIDLLIDNRVIVECKATATYNPIYEVQALAYLRLLNPKLALVIKPRQGRYPPRRQWPLAQCRPSDITLCAFAPLR
jgi:GxxExxY protein